MPSKRIVKSFSLATFINLKFKHHNQLVLRVNNLILRKLKLNGVQTTLECPTNKHWQQNHLTFTSKDRFDSKD